MKIVSSHQMRILEQCANQRGVADSAMMENAGLGMARCIRSMFRSITGFQFFVLVGPGNNGADGLVLARLLRSWGYRVVVAILAKRPDDDPKRALVARQGTLIIDVFNQNPIPDFSTLLNSSSIVIDSVLGIGNSRPLIGLISEIFNQVASAKNIHPELKIISVDVPSGIDVDTGSADPATLKSDFTFVLGRPKTGLYKLPAAKFIGKLQIIDIGIPSNLDDEINLNLMTKRWAVSLVPDRPLNSHKGTFGKALLVAGSSRYKGAAELATAAAGRTGAGLITLAIPSSLSKTMGPLTTEATLLPLSESSPGKLDMEAYLQVLEEIPNYDSLMIGCGLGQDIETQSFIENILFSDTPLPPTILDADSLNAISKTSEWWKRIKNPCILTPHLGEMSRLTGKPISQLETNRLEVATQSSLDWKQIVVFKGPFTIVAASNGEIFISPFANPGLATAGTGDILSGIVVSLLAQGLSSVNAASLGVFLHGSAGEMARDKIGEAGMIASDMLKELPEIIKTLNELEY